MVWPRYGQSKSGRPGCVAQPWVPAPHALCSITWAPCRSADADPAGLGGPETAVLRSSRVTGLWLLLMWLAYGAGWAKDSCHEQTGGEGTHAQINGNSSQRKASGWSWAPPPPVFPLLLASKMSVPVPFTRPQLEQREHLNIPLLAGRRCRVIGLAPISIRGFLLFNEPQPSLGAAESWSLGTGC